MLDKSKPAISVHNVNRWSLEEVEKEADDWGGSTCRGVKMKPVFEKKNDAGEI